MKALHLAATEDAASLLPMVGAFHEETGIKTDDADREAAVRPLLDGSPQGAIWLIGPRRSPVGYIALTFSWSIARGGLEATVTDFYIRPAIRGRGMGVEALAAIVRAMRAAELSDLHVEAPPDDARLAAFFAKRGFVPKQGSVTMTRPL